MKYKEFVNMSEAFIDNWVKDKDIKHMSIAYSNENTQEGTIDTRIVSFIYEVKHGQNRGNRKDKIVRGAKVQGK